MNNAVNISRPWVAKPQPAPGSPLQAKQNVPIERTVPLFAVFAGGLLVFMRFSMLPEIQTMVMGFPLYLLYIAAVPACLAIVLAGTLRRVFGFSTTYFWLAFMIWIAIATPFSTWRSASAHLLADFLRTNLPMLFVTASLAVTWRGCKWMFYCIAAGGLVDLLAARLFMKDYQGRLGLSLSTVGNPNDYAAHLLIVLPFILWFALSSKSIWLRVLSLGAIAFGLYAILSTASRGGMIALGVDVLFFLWKGSGKQKIAVLLLVPAAAISLLAIMPSQILGRLGSFTAGDTNREALESSQARRYLLDRAFEYSLQFPLFGVGPGEFGDYEGQTSHVMGGHGYYHGAHNSFLAVSAECGIPALIFMLAGVFSTLRLFNITLKEARLRDDCRDIRNAAFCGMMAVIGFCAAIFFLNFSYSYYLPTMAGLAVAVRLSALDEVQKRTLA